ncbi:septum site-determining protein Ssd [Amycolatopsis cihanbeyliensis]|uniref:Secretion/DNA translocation related CpaE-like protein n=1 Tax=Amycolatopsis cihanbeyliensis TaxID=1128664 RepID=A0A542DNA6_AMYCI|nr:septum site-determining protein Ssd [Amycolatopsis cihanbeyliensis]TQJ04464.1 secretion/DNA translocation related CpaE-like protein [Amycolatopsis cihanbeyliensis]
MGEQRPLAVINDETVLDEVLRLAAAVGCEVDRAADLPGARPQWTAAPLVILDEEAVRYGDPPPRRPGILLVCKGTVAPESLRRALRNGVERLVMLPDDEGELVSALADAVEGPVLDGRVLAVLGGRGGAGASVFAAGLGLGAVRAGGNALLVDCDPLGGGVDLLLGVEDEPGLRWPELRVNSGRVSMAALQPALPGTRHGAARLSVLSCGRDGADGAGPSGHAVAAVVRAGRRAGQLVVCDLPRHLPGAARPVLELADLVILVVPAELRACAAAAQVLRGLFQVRERVRVLVRGPSAEGLGVDQVAAAVGVPAVASVRAERAPARALLERRGGSLSGAARAVLETVRFDPSREGSA